MRIIKLVLVTVALIISSRDILAKEVPYTLEDRDRLIRVETRLDEVNKRFDDVNNSFNKRFDELRGFMIWGFGVTFAGIFSLMGFVLWDRRSALAPAIRKNNELEEREEVLEKWRRKIDMALRELAGSDTKVANVLRHADLL